MGTLWLTFFFFIRLRSKLSFVYCNTEIKLETALKKWINTIIQQSEYAKEKNTRQLRVRAGMQKNKKTDHIGLKRSTKDKNH